MDSDLMLGVLHEMGQERYNQEKHWDEDFDAQNTPNDWVAFITRYVSEGAYDGRDKRYTPEAFRESLIKAGALIVAAVERLDSTGMAHRHYDEYFLPLDKRPSGNLNLNPIVTILNPFRYFHPLKWGYRAGSNGSKLSQG